MSNNNTIHKKIYVLYPELDDPVICETKKEAVKIKRKWKKEDLEWSEEFDDVLGPFEYILNDK